MIFLIDLDGTFLDNSLCYLAHILLYPKYKGFELNNNEMLSLIELSYLEVARYYKSRFLKKIDLNELEHELEIFNRAIYANFSNIRKGGVELIQELGNGNENELYICSDSSTLLVRTILNRFLLTDKIKILKKPKLYHKKDDKYWKEVLSRKKFINKKIILIDDEINNIEAANNNGIFTIGVKNYPFNSHCINKLKLKSDAFIEEFNKLNINKIKEEVKKYESEFHQ